MAKKIEMHDEVIMLFKTCAVIFLESGIKTHQFYRWFESFKSYSDIKTMYNFMVRIRPILERAMGIWNNYAFDHTSWTQLKSISKASIHVQTMNHAILEFKNMWAKKPSRRRGSE